MGYCWYMSHGVYSTYLMVCIVYMSNRVCCTQELLNDKELVNRIANALMKADMFERVSHYLIYTSPSA